MPSLADFLGGPDPTEGMGFLEKAQWAGSRLSTHPLAGLAMGSVTPLGKMGRFTMGRFTGAAQKIDLPPIAKGFVRLFRGERNPHGPLEINQLSDKGRWFSTDKTAAEFYGNVKYVDVPESMAKILEKEQQEAVRLGAGGIYNKTGRLLPVEWANKARFMK